MGMYTRNFRAVSLCVLYLPSGSTYEGQWQNGKRHALGVESRGRWVYRGEWTQGAKGRYGVRQSAASLAKYEGTWASGLQDGYGSETYADGGTYQGQWLRGMRHGYGVRASAPFGQASHYRPHKSQLRASMSSLRSNDAGGGGGGGAGGALDPAAERDRRVDDSRGGFVLKAKSDEPPARRRSLVEKSGLKRSILSGLKLRKQRSTGDIEKRGTSGGSMRSNASSASWVSTESEQSAFTSASQHTDSNASFVIEDEHMDASVTETYMGEWKNDKRSGFGLSERSDGLRYEGEWFNNKKYGYGVTTFKDGTREEGKYKNNVLITSQKKKHLFLIRSAKFRERIDAAVSAAQRASKIALQKADIAISRTATARGKAELADIAAEHAREDHETARLTAKQFAPDFNQPGLDRIGKDTAKFRSPAEDAVPGKSILTKTGSIDHMNHTPTQQQQAPSQAQQHAQQQAQAQAQQQQQQQQQLLQQQLQTQHLHNQLQQQLQQQQQMQQSYNQQYNLPPQYQSTITPPTPLPMETNAMPNFQQMSGVSLGLGQATQGLAQGLGQMGPGMSMGHQHPGHQDGDNMSTGGGSVGGGRRTSLRRNSRLVSSVSHDSPAYNFQQAMSDHFDQYKRPPSRDSSVDRYSRAAMGAARLSSGSRQPSVDKSAPPEILDRTQRAGSSARGTTPAPGGGSNGSAVGAGAQGLGVGPRGSLGQAVGHQPMAAPAPYAVPSSEQPFEDVLLRKRNLGQDIIPSPAQPKRTESLYINPAARGAAPKLGGSVALAMEPVQSMWYVEDDDEEDLQFSPALMARRASESWITTAPVEVRPAPRPVTARHGVTVTPVLSRTLTTRRVDQSGAVPNGMPGDDLFRARYTALRGVTGRIAQTPGTSVPVTSPLQRKKSLPDVAAAPNEAMSREEVSVLSSARREEIRRLQEENERLRANPLLYLVSPHVKDWFSRQQLVMLVLFVNISLAIMFFKLLT
ncbi:Junctophilin-3 [Frankliniella fusca]|uniref:Junctophilin-3 n=1 Tax=Frankliniella fusca TaxID=407009 RepID=A0AAE1HFE6_9NEOP|nr:Junctophilin-3 [Frankliniella fusca]